MTRSSFSGSTELSIKSIIGRLTADTVH